MNRFFYVVWITFLYGFLTACGNSDPAKIAVTKDEKKDSVPLEKDILLPKSKYADLLKKFKPISFDTLKVFYEYNNKAFLGRELTLKEAGNFVPGILENSLGKLSGVFACYQFQMDSVTLGLIVRTPSEYESSSIKLFLFDTKKDQLKKNDFELGQNIGDGGEYYRRVSWLIKTKENKTHSFVYDYSSYSHEVADTDGDAFDEWRSYFVIDCLSSKFDTISKNEVQLKKRFKRLLLTEE